MPGITKPVLSKNNSVALLHPKENLKDNEGDISAITNKTSKSRDTFSYMAISHKENCDPKSRLNLVNRSGCNTPSNNRSRISDRVNQSINSMSNNSSMTGRGVQTSKNKGKVLGKLMDCLNNNPQFQNMNQKEKFQAYLRSYREFLV